MKNREMTLNEACRVFCENDTSDADKKARYNEAVYMCREAIKKGYKLREDNLMEDGTLIINYEEVDKVGRVLVEHDLDGTLYYRDEDEKVDYKAEDMIREIMSYAENSKGKAEKAAFEKAAEIIRNAYGIR